MAPPRPRRSLLPRWAVVAALGLALLSPLPSAAAASSERERLEASVEGASGQARIGPLVDLVVASRQEAPERALSAGGEALALLAQWPDPASEVRVLNEMGWAHMVLGRYDEATTITGRGRALAEREGDSAGLARALNNLGVIARSQGEPGQAIVLFEQALVIERSLARPPRNRRGIEQPRRGARLRSGRLRHRPALHARSPSPARIAGRGAGHRVLREQSRRAVCATRRPRAGPRALPARAGGSSRARRADTHRGNPAQPRGPRARRGGCRHRPCPPRGGSRPAAASG